MDDVLGYAGKRVVVTGAASGMGAATAASLVDLGATVIALDRADVRAPVGQRLKVDLLERASITTAVGAIGGPIHAIFNCAGLPGAPASERDTMIVNFIGARELIEQLVPKMPPGGAIAYVASAGGLGWEQNIEKYRPLFEAEGFEAGVGWLDANVDVWEWSGYATSKQAINAWIAWRCWGLMKEHGIRLNCVNPGPTDTAMMPAFHESAGKDLVDSAQGPIGRYSTAEEQAWPMIFLNSHRSSYVLGASVYTDGGFYGSLLAGTLKMGALAPPAE